MSRRVLVVGGAGYIGSHCAWLLEERGVEVVVFDDLSTGHRQAVRSELVVGDLRDREALRRVFRSRPFDAVMHFAARALVGESMTAPADYFDVNVGGTTTLLAAMSEAGVQSLVFSSSCSIYGAPSYLPVDERHPTGPLSPYGLSKLLVEQMFPSLRAGQDMRISSLRYFNAAGAHPDGLLGESHHVETHLVPLAFEALMGKRPALKVFGRDYDTPDGTCVRDYVHVMDLADAHHRALQHMWAGSPGQAWNLGTGTGSSVLEVIHSIERVTGRPVPRSDAPRRAGDPPGLWASPHAIKDQLGWTPAYTQLDDIVQTAWAWTRSPRY